MMGSLWRDVLLLISKPSRMLRAFFLAAHASPFALYGCQCPRFDDW